MPASAFKLAQARAGCGEEEPVQQLIKTALKKLASGR